MKAEVLRTCIGCGETHDKKSMLRIVRDGSGEIHPDESGRANGRGAYICMSAECLEKAVKRHGFDRAFKASVSADDIRSIKEFFTERDFR